MKSFSLQRSIVAFGTLGLIFSVTAARAAISPIASPFSGAHTETFESFPNFASAGIQSSLIIMSGFAEVDYLNEVPGLFVYEINAAPPANRMFSDSATDKYPVADGVKGLGAQGTRSSTPAAISFNAPVSEFGAFWGRDQSQGAGTVLVSFFDINDNLISTEQFTYDHNQNGGVLDWHGWSSDVGISYLEYFSDNDRFDVLVDGLQAGILASPVPEPGTYAAGLLLCGFTAAQVRKHLRDRKAKRA